MLKKPMEAGKKRVSVQALPPKFPLRQLCSRHGNRPLEKATFKMRLAVIMTMSSPWAKELVLRFCELGHEVHVLNVSENPNDRGYLADQTSLLQMENADLHNRSHIHNISPSFNSALRYFVSGFTLRNILRKNNIDILLATYAGGFATMAYASAFRPFIVYAVGTDILFSSGIKRIITRLTLGAAEKIFANGAYLTTETRRLTHRNDVENLYMGVDTNRFSPGIAEKNELVILCTRGFLPVYNNEYLIQALALLPEDTPYREVIFSSTGTALEKVKSLADKILPSSIRRKIRFLGGVSNDELLFHLQRASIFVSLSRSDGASISLMEALACGLFPVLSDIPQNREWIDTKRTNGLLVPLDNPEAAGKALLRALVDDKMRQAAAIFNRATATERADGRKNMKFMAAELSRIVSRY
jgi:glycosyltransferase involved in cell wall biosynthesis